MAVVRTRRTIDTAGAEAVIAAAEQVAEKNGYRVVMCVVDPWGEVVQMRRTEGAQIASSRVAVDKARTAAIFIRPSREMEEQVDERTPRRARAARRQRADGRHPVEGRRRGRRRDRHQRRDTGRGRGRLTRGRAAEFSTTSFTALTRKGAKLAAEAIAGEAARRGVAPVIRPSTQAARSCICTGPTPHRWRASM